MHGMMEMFDDLPNTNTLLDDKAITSGWQAYKQVNRAFRDKVSIRVIVLLLYHAVHYCIICRIAMRPVSKSTANSETASA